MLSTENIHVRKISELQFSDLQYREDMILEPGYYHFVFEGRLPLYVAHIFTGHLCLHSRTPLIVHAAPHHENLMSHTFTSASINKSAFDEMIALALIEKKKGSAR